VEVTNNSKKINPQITLKLFEFPETTKSRMLNNNQNVINRTFLGKEK